MLYDLVVMFEFSGRKIGERITDAGEIAAVLASPAANLVRRVYHVEGGVLVPPPVYNLPSSTAVSVTIGGVAYPFTLADLRTYLGVAAPPVPIGSVADFSNPANSGLIAALAA